MKKLMVVSLLLVMFGISAKASWAVDYLPVKANVAYSAVTALDYKLPDDIVSYGADSLQTASLWFADNSAKSDAPLVVLVHGGCWLNAYDIKHTYALSTALAQSGYSVWSVEYRRTGDVGGGWPGSFEDVVKAIEQLTAYGKKPFSLANTVVVGHSAGGHLALLAGAKLPELAGVIGLAAISDIEAYSLGQNSCQQVTSRFMGGSVLDKPQAYKEANPVAQRLHSHTFLLQGEADNIVPISQATVPGVPVVMQQDAGHFDWVHPGTPAFQTLLIQLNKAFK